MKKIKWCCRIKKGFQLVERNINLSKAYLEKAKKSLEASSKLEGNKDWQISSSYYAMYFSLYSILIRIGVECENHDCTLEFIKEFFGEDFVEDIDFLFESRSARLDAQYYPEKDVSETLFRKIVRKAPKIFIMSKEINIKLNEERINLIRNEIKKLKKSK